MQEKEIYTNYKTLTKPRFVLSEKKLFRLRNKNKLLQKKKTVGSLKGNLRKSPRKNKKREREIGEKIRKPKNKIEMTTSFEKKKKGKLSPKEEEKKKLKKISQD